MDEEQATEGAVGIHAESTYPVRRVEFVRFVLSASKFLE